MQTDPHMHTDYFFSIIQNRLFKYMDAIWGNGGYSPNIASYVYHNAERFRALNAQDNFCGKGFWGYGINTICDGKDSHSHLDVEDIRRDPKLNKHHEPYRQFLVLTFKVEGNSLYVSTFALDSVTAGVNANINTRYELKDFKNARITTRNEKTIVEFVFAGVEKAISFQVDNYHFPGYLSGNQLAKYYIDTIKKLSNEVIEKEKADTKPRVFDFIKDFTTSIHLLQKQDINAECIRKLKEDGKKDESAFRYWFQMSFIMAGYTAEPEPEKGNGRIDLKVGHTTIADQVIEFKGWWNSDKKNIVNQLRSYLTDFEKDGYIFMINHTKKSIETEYKGIITNDEMNYIPNSWSEISTLPSGYTYFKSEHNFTRRKTIYHFLFSIE